ncbi:hypothetical protein HB775_28570 (plasmid) [Rhizobium leguminosarum bv. trifolii]|nr:hypothetical protein HB775_28570 [Rhizobium leguminosarum bv. trifolii]
MGEKASNESAVDRVAFIAVQASLDGGRLATFDVVAVGTRAAKPEEWRYARHSLETFLARTASGAAIFDDAGSAKGDVFSNVVLVAFYTYDQDGASGMPQPIVRLDTACFVELDDGRISLGLPSDDNWHVSTLYVTPDATKRGVLKSFDLRAHVPMALNGHYVTADDKNGDRFDSRVLLQVSAEQKSKPRSLWDKAKNSGSIPEPTPEFDAVFDRLALTITTRSYSSGDTRPSVTASNNRLSNLGVGSYEGTLTDIPLWAAAGLKQPTGAVKVVRRWGFRVGEFRGETNIPRRMILRLECQPQQKLGALSFWRATEALLTGVTLDPHTIADTLKRPCYSQEQRLQDISAGLTPGLPVRWIVAVRLESENDPLELTAALLAGLPNAQRDVESAFRRVADGSEISALPAISEFAEAGTSMHWQVVGQLLEARAWRRLVPSPKLKHPDDPHRSAFWNVVEPRMLDDYWADPAKVGDNLHVTATAEFPGIMSASGSILDQSIRVTVTAPIRAYFDSADEVPCVRRPARQPAVTARDDSENIDPGVRFGLYIAAMPVKSDVIIGAFRLILGTDDVSPLAKLKEQMCLIRPYRTSGTRLQEGVELALTLPVFGLMPEGQDPPIGATGTAKRDRTRQLLADEVRPEPSDPLMFAKTGTAASRYELVVRETAARGRDHEVRLMLRSVSDDSKTAASGLVLVIDPEPFRVMGVRYVEPRGAVGDEANEVAVWNAGGEGGLSWRVKDENQRVELLLPPQIIGEAMEKNRSDDPARPPDITPGKPAAARFGSPTVVVVDPTYADTGYREPGWNLRRILGFPGQRSPGARLRHLRTELMYGLTTRLVPQDDIWITEVGATFGVPPQKLAEPASAHGAKGRHVALANAVIAAEKRRLSIEKLWAGKPDQPLRIESGLTFALRYNRRNADGSLTPGGPATPFRWPVPGDIPSDLPLSPSQRALIEGTFAVSRDDRRSFPGGVPWAFESANILSEVYREPVSQTGRIQDVHLSALGAWAGQRALFAEDKSVIDTEVTMGRLQRYKLERIGRIGALWHRAKHVIVYERTVVPPRQFYNRYPIGAQQDEHLGRPVLRKVEEYVELLQPVRRYPENGTSISAAGFLTGVEFKSKRIPVDSRWGGDVRREGWAVPLWKTAFAQPETGSKAPGQKDNPDDPSLIYPKPQIRCLLRRQMVGKSRSRSMNRKSLCSLHRR